MRTRLFQSQKSLKVEHKSVVIVLVIVIVIVVVLAGIRISLMKSPIGSCETLIDNNGKIGVTFLSEGVAKEKLVEFANYLMSSEPYASDKEKFNFYYVGETGCEVVYGSVILCYSSDLVRRAASCDSDIIVAVSSRNGLRSSAYGNVVSLSSGLPKTVFLHEFGHAFANLADEYVPSEIPRGSQNCQKSCSFKISEGCFEGCSKNEYYRSIDSSVMRTLSTSNYGKLNTQIIQNALDNY